MKNNNMTEEQVRKKLADSISQDFYLGELPYVFYRMIDKCLYEYGFETKVVYMLFAFCYDKSMHRSLQAVEQLADKWHKNGYKNIEDLEEPLRKLEKTYQILKLCARLFRKKLNEIDKERIIKWVNKYDTTEELVKLAFIENEFRSVVTIKNIDDTLAKWHENGVITTEDAAQFCEKEHQKNIEKKKFEFQAKEKELQAFSFQPLWHNYSEKSPVRNGPYLVTQRKNVNDGESITVEKRWFLDGEWPLTQYEKNIGAKLEILSWAYLPSPYTPQIDMEE